VGGGGKRVGGAGGPVSLANARAAPDGAAAAVEAVLLPPMDGGRSGLWGARAASGGARGDCGSGLGTKEPLLARSPALLLLLPSA